ncbi:MAG: hypothetical protein Q7S21_06620 [archaeon]|nr:hypothetical protein [archaeon]
MPGIKIRTLQIRKKQDEKRKRGTKRKIGTIYNSLDKESERIQKQIVYLSGWFEEMIQRQTPASTIEEKEIKRLFGELNISITNFFNRLKRKDKYLAPVDKVALIHSVSRIYKFLTSAHGEYVEKYDDFSFAKKKAGRN